MRARYLALALLAVACSKKTNDAPKATGSANHPTDESTMGPKPDPSGAPWKFDAAAVEKKLQGAWVVKDHGYLGSVEAWNVTGNHVKIWDAKSDKETDNTLVIKGPCVYEIQEPGGSSTVSHYVFDGDTLHMGLGDAGVKQDGKIVACMSNGVFVLDGTKCAFYLDDFGKWSPEEGTCSLDGLNFKASNASFHYDGSMPAHGDVFASDQLWNNAPVKAASYDEAKAKAKG
jgi:hypothetical protein